MTARGHELDCVGATMDYAAEEQMMGIFLILQILFVHLLAANKSVLLGLRRSFVGPITWRFCFAYTNSR